jgi:hypothetical protein
VHGAQAYLIRRRENMADQLRQETLVGKLTL